VYRQLPLDPQDVLLMALPARAPDGRLEDWAARLPAGRPWWVVDHRGGQVPDAWRRRGCRGWHPPGWELLVAVVDWLVDRGLLPDEGPVRRFASSDGRSDSLWASLDGADGELWARGVVMAAQWWGPETVAPVLERAASMTGGEEAWDEAWQLLAQPEYAPMVERLARTATEGWLRCRAIETLPLVVGGDEALICLQRVPADVSVHGALAWARLEAAGRAQDVEALVHLAEAAETPGAVRARAAEWSLRRSSSAWDAAELRAALERWTGTKATDAAALPPLPADVLRERGPDWFDRLPAPHRVRAWSDWARSGDLSLLDHPWPPGATVASVPPDPDPGADPGATVARCPPPAPGAGSGAAGSGATLARDAILRALVRGDALTVPLLRACLARPEGLSDGEQQRLLRAAVLGPLAAESASVLEPWVRAGTRSAATEALRLALHRGHPSVVQRGWSHEDPEVRAHALVAAVEQGGPGVPRWIRAGLADEGPVRWRAAWAAGQVLRPSTAVFREFLRALGELADVGLFDAAREGAQLLGSAGAPMVAAIEQAWSDFEPTEPSPPAVPPSHDAASPGAGSAPPTVPPSHPAPPTAPPQLSEARSRQALDVALRSGAQGFKLLLRLCASPRVPGTIRAQAVARLATDYPNREAARRALEDALFSEEPAVVEAAVAGLARRADARLDPLLRFVSQSKTAPAVARALRFIVRRWPKERIRPHLERALEDPSSLVRRVALHGLFSSLRFVDGNELEQRLVNLMEQHEDPTVRTSAAAALGTYGGRDCLSALDAAQGPFRPPGLRQAAHRAAFRIRRRT
jgi:hypothetical protein